MIDRGPFLSIFEYSGTLSCHVGGERGGAWAPCEMSCAPPFGNVFLAITTVDPSVAARGFRTRRSAWVWAAVDVAVPAAEAAIAPPLASEGAATDQTLRGAARFVVDKVGTLRA